MNLVVFGRSDEILGRFGLHLFLDLVAGLIVEESVRVSSPGDSLHDAAIVIEVEVTIDEVVPVLQLVLVWD
jgi:hypothetical protein